MNEHDTKLDYLRQKPQTDLEKLRSDLDRLDKLVGSLRYLGADEAKKIPALFDRVDEGFKQIEGSNTELKGERAQWETISLSFKKQAAIYVRILGGREALQKIREEVRPDSRQWWWYPDRQLSEGRRSQAMRAGLWLGLALVILGGLVFSYQRFLAPDEATQTSLRHSFNAEKLADQGDYQAAFNEVEQAIEAKAGQPDLYLFKGVLAELLVKPDVAAEAFLQAEAGSPDRLTFVQSRATKYLRFGQFERAIQDTQIALALDSDEASAYLILGQAYEGSGDYQKALDNYRLADKLATEQDDAQVQVIARMSIGQLYNKLPALSPTDVVGPTP